MARLLGTSAFAAGLPRRIGGLTLAEHDPGPVTSVAPFRGREAAVSAALEGALGLGFPAPNAALASGTARALWAGRGRALILGAPLPDGLGEDAALVDLTSGFAWLHLTGQGVEDVLARLVPLDLRPAAFPEGRTARSLVGHMSASITRLGPETLELAVMRSMAGTLLHEVTQAAEGIAARARAGR